MPSYKTAFGSYIKAEDLGGRAVRVSIERVTIEEIKSDGKTEKKLVAHFAGKDKGLVLNRTNADTLNEIFGTDDYDEWTGPIVLFPDTTMFGGKKVPCVRLRSNNGTSAPPPPPVDPVEPVTDDDIPF